MNITKTIQQIQQVMRKDPGLDGDAQRITQLSWLLFLKALDRHEKVAAERDVDYELTIDGDLSWHEWTRRHFDLSGDSLLEFVNARLIPQLRVLEGEDELAVLVRENFDGIQNYMRSGALLAEVIAHVDSLVDARPGRQLHFVGAVYEKVLADLQSAGNAGEFYTPKALTDIIARLVDPSPKETILDFACGTGGFLVSCLEHIRSKHPGTPTAKLSKNLRGVEKKAVPYLLCCTNMLLHDCPPNGNLAHDNLLTHKLQSFGPDSLVDVIVTNPPFGAMEEESSQINAPKELRSRDTADLFVGLMLNLLKPGGRAAIILPDGFLFATGVKRRLREKLLSTCDVHTIVRLPKGVFSPYTGIATNILFLKKGEPTSTIWYFEHRAPESIGSYTKTRPIQLEDFSGLTRWWTERGESANAWQISVSDISKQDYRLDSKKRPSKSTRQNPKGLVAKVANAEKRLVGRQERLAEFVARIVSDESPERSRVLRTYSSLMTGSIKGLEGLKRCMLALAMEGRLLTKAVEEESVTDLMARLAELGGGRHGKEGVQARKAIPKWRNEIPKHWRLVRLSELGRIEGGGTPQAGDPENFSENGVRWVTPADLYGIKGKYIGRGRRDLSESGYQRSSAKLMPTGSVLFSSRAPIGYLAIASNEICTNQGFKSCVPFIPEMNEFIYYFLMYERPWIEDAAPGTTFKEVSGQFMKSIAVPLPPVSEQRQIVATLDEGLSLVEDGIYALNECRTLGEAAIDRVISYVSG